MADYRFQQRDFLGILNDIKMYYRERLGDKWTDASESDASIALMEAFSYSVKNLHYYVDQQKRESDVVTAVRPRNVYWKALRDGYTPHGYRPSTGRINLVFSENTESGVTIPRGTLFQTKYDDDTTNLIVTTLEDQEISSGPIDVDVKNTFELEVVQGQIKTITKTRQDITQNGYIKLPSEKISTDVGMTKVVFHRTPSEDVEWIQSEDVYTDYREGNYFSVHPLFLRNLTTTMIQFPYNWPELLDTDGSIEITYLETEGESGFIPASVYNSQTETFSGGVEVLNSNLFDNSTPPKNISSSIGSIYNTQPISGGLNTESVASIKVNVKSAIRDLKTLVTLQDYQDFARIQTGTNVRAMDISTDGSIPGRCIYVYVELSLGDSEGYEAFEPGNRPAGMSVMEYIYYYMGLNADPEDNMVWNPDDPNLPHSYEEFWKSKYGGVVGQTNDRRGRRDLVLFLTSSFAPYKIQANIWLGQGNETPDEIMLSIKSKLEEELGTIPQIGKTHYISNIISILQKSAERVKSVELITPDADVVPEPNQVPKYTIEENAIRFKYLDGSPDVLLPETKIVG